MAQTPKPERKRVGDYNPDVAVGELLDPIANIDVTLWSVAFDGRTGKKGPYILAIMEVSGENEDREAAALYHTGGTVVVERLIALFGLTIDQLQSDYLNRNAQPDGSDVFPVTARFTKEKSASNPGQSYWTVS
jgi:hypothetical protein